MRAVVVQCHPLRSSYNEALLDRALAGIRAAGSEPELYRLAESAGPAPADLDGVDLLAFVHPVWWGGHPAPLLGWVQQLLGPWIDGAEPADTSPLRTVRELLTVTSLGSSWMVNRLQGENARRLMSRTVLPLCAPGAHHHWTALYKLDRVDRSELTAFLDTVDGNARAAADRLTTSTGADRSESGRRLRRAFPRRFADRNGRS